MFHAVMLLQGAGETPFLQEAVRTLGPQWEGQAVFDLFATDEVDTGPEVLDRCRKALEDADFVYLSIHGGLPYFRRFDELRGLFLGRVPTFVWSAIDDEMRALQADCRLSPPVFARLRDYFDAGGVENLENFLRFAMAELGGLPAVPGPVQWPRWDGLYGADPGREESEILREIDGQDGPVTGILVHYHNIAHRNTAHIDALMEAVREKGGTPLAVYTNMMPANNYGGLNAVIDRYFLAEGKPRIDVLIVTSGHSLTALAAPGDGQINDFESVFARLGVPVIQAMSTYFTYEQWLASKAGLDSMGLCSSVYQPEFDGQIISVPIGYTEAERTPGGIQYRTRPIPDRVKKAAGLAMNWAKLRRTPMEEKRVAVILHNMPPRADMIGCAYGLDTPESVYHMVEALRSNGLRLDYDFADGQEIISAITKGLTNDCRFLSSDEILQRCEAAPGPEVWRPWFVELPDRVRQELRRDWGEPPGDFMAADGKVLIPGIHNGNLFIGLQPPRGREEKAEEAYHSTDLVCPYQYLAFYRYLRDVFRADVIVHVGTHGTLEWLPGKEIGLSGACYPDIAMGETPHLYPYIIDVPGEGAQAKRRSGAVILDHLIPSMTDSGLYGPLEELDGEIARYCHAQINDPQKLEGIAARIWELAAGENLDRDLGLSAVDFQAEPQRCIERLHVWLSEIKSAKIKNGLHIFGQVPEGQRYADMLRLLAYGPNGEVPSLREGACALLGWDSERLLDNPGEADASGVTNARKLEQADELGRRVMERLADAGYTVAGVKAVLEELRNGEPFPGTSGPLEACLTYLVERIVPKLGRTTDETENFLRGVRGEFVPQGPSGAPSRGNAEILPTGRNFYMIDPTAVPSRAAWETGRRLARDLLEKHRREQGKLPESIAIVVYSGETIKTGGDDIAEILYLYGVRPVWLAHTDRVIGLEAIPLSELGRPRIDVTLRISGLFRDTFPNLIERIEDAVNLVAALDEPEGENYVKKHIAEDVRAFLDQGMEREQAFTYARLRVFGCPPGTYGAGVGTLINSKQWQSRGDLGEAYITWSAHAYSRKLHGETVREVFSRRLAGTEATVKNISSVEMDMLDSDDFYNYHGGLISAVESQSGRLPASYSTDAGDPRHVSTRTIHEDVSRIMRARIANPKWAAGLREHGYKGAQEVSAMVDIVFGWDAASGVVDDWMYDAIANTYLLDAEMREWLQEVNPWAVHAMSERLLEAQRRGMWDADDGMIERLSEIFLASEGELEGL